MFRRALRRAARLARPPRRPRPRPAPPARAAGREEPVPAGSPEPVEVEIDAATALELATAPRDGAPPLFIDVREPHEVATGTIAGAWHLPMADVPAHLDRLPRDRPLVIACAVGGRSFSVACWLRDQGFDQAWSLVGGVGAWAAAGGPLGDPGEPPPRWPRGARAE